MEKSAVTEILKTFSKDELGRFGDFVSSPYHNKKSNLIKLYNALRKYSPLFPVKETSKEELWKKIFPGKKYNYGIMKNLVHDLNKLLVSFLDTEKHSANKYAQDVNILEQYNERNMINMFTKKLAKTKKEISNAPNEYNIYYYRYLLEYMEISMVNKGYHFKAKGTDLYSKLNRALALFYFSNQFHNNTNCEQMAHVINIDVNRDFHNLFNRFYFDSGYNDIYTRILYLAYSITADLNNGNDYYELKKLFFENRNGLTGMAQYGFVLCLLNFVRNNATKGHKQYSSDEFSYIKIIIDERLYRYAHKDAMDQYLYMGAVMSACRAGEYNWAENFIEKYTSELPRVKREMFKNHAYTSFNLRVGNFEKALYYISQYKNVDDGDKLNVKVFEFNAYYELGYYDEVMSLADTTAHFLRNDKIFSKADKDAFKNYVSCVTKLIKYKCGIGKSRSEPNYLENVERFINGNEILNKTWLLKKTYELKTLKV